MTVVSHVWRRLRPTTAGALGALGVLSMGLIASGGAPTSEAAYGGLLIVWAAALPGLVYLQNPEGAAPIAPVSGIYYLLFFGVPVFAAPLAFRAGDRIVLYARVALNPIDVSVVLLVAAGVALMFGAFHFARRTMFRSLPRFRLSDPEPPAAIVNALLWVLAVASLTYRFIPQMQSVPSIGQFLDPAGYLALGGFYLQWRAGRLPRVQAALVAIAVVPLEILWRAQSFYLTPVLFLPLFFSFILWRTRQFRSLALLALGCAVIATAYGAIVGSRFAAPMLEKAAGIVRYAATIVGDAGRTSYATVNGLDITYDRRLSPLVNRMGQIWIFQTVYERSPDLVPYMKGETYRPLLTAVVPRVIYPGKPVEKAGALFGYRYGFTESQNDSTSFNIPWLVELLANFGPLGVLAGMPLLGVLLAFVDKLFNNAGSSDLEFLIGLTLIFKLVYQESNFSEMTGSLPLLFVSFFVYFHFGTKALGAIMLRASAR